MNASDVFFGLHSINGTLVIPITILVLIGLSFGARYPWRTTGFTAVLVGLWVIQYVLAAIGFAGVAVVAGLHGVNALILVGMTIFLVVRNWAFRRQPAPVGQPAQSELTGASTRT